MFKSSSGAIIFMRSSDENCNATMVAQMTDCKHFDSTDPGNANLDNLGSRELLVVGDQIQRPDHQLPVLGLAVRSGLD